MDFDTTRHNKPINYYFSIAFFFILLLAIYFYINRSEPKMEAPHTAYAECDHTQNATAPITTSTKLNDINDVHLLHARTNGLSAPISSNEVFEKKIDSLVEKNTLIKVEENDIFKIKRLRHSHAYLVPVAVEMIHEIAYRFNKKLREEKMSGHQFYITSMLRTEETQRKLSRSNINATYHTAHYYGTTIDISYKDFYDIKKRDKVQNAKLAHLLGEVLVQMRQECKIVAVRERKQACFHITVVACKPSEKEK